LTAAGLPIRGIGRRGAGLVRGFGLKIDEFSAAIQKPLVSMASQKFVAKVGDPATAPFGRGSVLRPNRA
jgi:hypothetical protein